MKQCAIILGLFMIAIVVRSQDKSGLASLPVNLVTSTGDNSKPLIMYISGDGGWNSFSQGFTKELAVKGYPVVSLNANKYFWKKKTPAQAAADVSLLITEYCRLWNRTKVTIIGYSFGADVAPFIYNRLPADLLAKIKSVVLMSPSSTTDFEVHLMGMIGGRSGGSNVPAEINKLSAVPVLIISGDDETDFPFDQLTSKKLTRKTINGGHHYDGNVSAVCSIVIQNGL